MRRRGIVIAGAVLLALGAAPFLAWPLVEGMVARSAEDRLRQETGQEWRIRGGASLGFRPTPQVTFHDVSVGARDAASGPSATIKRVRLADPWSLMAGGASINAVAEGVDLRSPLSGSTAAMRLGGISAIRAELAGATAALAESGRVLVASAELVDLGLSLAKGTAKTAIEAKLALPDHDATLAGELSGGADGQPITGPIRVAVTPRQAASEGAKVSPHRLEASARLRVLPGSLALDSLAGGIDGEPFSGTLAVALAAKPKITGDLSFEALTLTREGAPSPAARPDGLVVAVPADTVPVPAWFAGFDASGVLRFARLTLGEVPLKDIELKSDVRQSGLDLGLVKARAFEGGARGRYVLIPEQDGSGRHQLSLSLNGVRVVSVLSRLAGARGIDGTGSLRADLQARGEAPDALRRSLTGSAELSVKDGQINGLDLAGTMGMLPKIIQGVPQIGALATRLDSLSASFSIADGCALTNDLDIRTAVIGASGIGSIDLFAKTLDIHLKPSVTAGGRPGAQRGRIDVPIRITGPWSGPNVSADMSGLAKDPGGAIQTLQDLGAGLMEGDPGKIGDRIRENLGENLGGLLDGLFPRQDRPQPGRPKP